MPNLLDVIELVKPRTSDQTSTEMKNFIAEAQSAYRFLSSIGAVNGIRELQENTNKAIAEKRQIAFNKGLSLPPELHTCSKVSVGRQSQAVVTSLIVSTDHSPDTLGWLSQRPQSTLEKLRHVTDALGMVVMPYDVLDSRSVKAEDWNVRSSIDNFVANAKRAGLDTYVIAPLALYDVAAHIASAGTQGTYSKVHQSTLATISLQLPLFRTMYQALQGLGTRVAALEAANVGITAQIQSLQAQMANIQNQVAEQRRELALQKASMALAAELEASRPSFFAQDPLLFAVRSGLNLAEDGPALIGPAWGPDFSPLLLDVYGLRVVRGQRKKLEQ